MKLQGYQVELREIEERDLSMLRTWRNDSAVSQYMLSQEVITEEQQLAWFRKIKRDKGQQHFVISYKGQPIGSANIKSRGINQSLLAASAIEPGLYIAVDKYRNNILAFAPTLLLNDYCFDTLNAQKLVAVVKSDNQGALNYNKKLGYQVDKQGELIDISLTFEDYQMHSKQLKAFLSR